MQVLCRYQLRRATPGINMAETKSFILSEESVNSYGFWVRTEGIRIDEFMANPVMLYAHDDELLPIGKWSNIRKEGGKLLADPEFDQADAFALSIQAKVEGGFIKAASIGFDIVKTSVEPQYYKPGQTKATVLECVLSEASICIIGANRQALRLKGKNTINLAFGELENQLPPFNNPIMKEVLKVLGLPEDSSETAVVLAINLLKGLAENHDELATELAVRKGIVAEADKAVFLGKLKADSTLGKVVLMTPAKEVETPAHVDLAKFLNEQKEVLATATATETWAELAKKSPQVLLDLEKNDKDKFNKLYKAHFGCDPTPMRQEHN